MSRQVESPGYPRRRPGMDHERYDWSMLSDRPALHWPEDRPLALWINLCLEHFPLNPAAAGFKAHGSMSMPYPDLRHYTLRDYGNRVGVYRILDALAAHGWQASLAVNAELALRYPALMRDLRDSGQEWIGHGWNMDRLHVGGMDAEVEAAQIRDSLAALRCWAPQPLRGWFSPARSQSAQTPELLHDAGIDWFADWVNDELPYPVKTAQGRLTALPLSMELEDRFVIGENLHSEAEWAEQCIDACEFLLAEAQALGSARLLTLNLHAWVIGQPHRIGHLERLLAHLASRRALVWNAPPSVLVDHVLAA